MSHQFDVCDVGFRSVVHSDILSERPAMPVIIVMTGPQGQPKRWGVQRRTRTGPPVRVDNEAVAEAFSVRR